MPKHLLLNLNRCARIFPQQRLALISDQPLTFFKNISDNLQKRIEIFKYSESILQPEESKVLFTLKHDMRFRRGYWRLTLERLFALKYFQREFKSPILHLESDILLLPNFPFKSIFDYAGNSLMWGDCRVGEDSAALFYSPNLLAISKFIDEARNLLTEKPNSTDMSLLYQIRNSSVLDVKLFPTRSRKIDKSLLSENAENSKHNNLYILQGSFDSAAFGMWLTGIDPRNDYGFTIVGDSGHIFESEYLDQPQFYRDLDFTDEGILNVDKFPIYSIHVHSKNPKLFGEDWENRLRKFVNSSRQHQRIRIVGFSPLLFTSLILSNLSDRTLLSFLSHFLKRIRTYISRRTSND